MPENLPERPKLLIISDTFVVKREDGRVEAFEPVVREIDAFKHLFSSITWIAIDWTGKRDSTTLYEMETDSLHYYVIQGHGGHRILDKFGALVMALRLFPLIAGQILKHDVIHTRSPSVPAFIGVLISFILRGKKYWHKYALNWGQESPPLSYRIQRWFLKQAENTKVTINGQWPGQPRHCLSFENPCLKESEYEEGQVVAAAKTFRAPFTLCFVGRLEDVKGVRTILEALRRLGADERIEKIHFVGNGPDRESYEAIAETLPFHIQFHGYLSRQAIAGIYAESHALLLPTTAAEGFPKVIAEAANYGCIPIVSDVSCIGQYVNTENGYRIDWQNCSAEAYLSLLLDFLSDDQLKRKAEQLAKMVAAFTYDHYNTRISAELA